PGAFFPMSLALNNTANAYFYEAASPITLQRAPAKKVVALLEQQPALTLDLLKRVYRGTDGLLARTVHLMSGDAHARLLFELTNAGLRFGTKTNDGAIHIPLTETDIAKRAGLSRETVSRII